MSVFDLDYSIVWRHISPPFLRGPKLLAWGEVLLKPLQYLRNLVLDDYANGSNYPVFSTVSIYHKNDRVIYKDRAVYENLTGSTNILPSDTNNWRKINNSYIGARERARYSAQIMTFEYSLNRNFQCNGIYIVNTPNINSGFLMGQNSETSSYMDAFPTAGSSPGYMANSYIPQSLYNYTIMVPNTIYTGLSVSLSASTKIIRSFADTINIAGMSYTVSGY